MRARLAPVLLLLHACLALADGPAAAVAPAHAPAAPRQVQAAAYEALDCLLEPNRVVDVATAVRGVLDEVLVERGDLVEAGQVLARLDSKVEQAAFELARARGQAGAAVSAEQASLELASRRNERISSLYSQKVVSTDQYDEARIAARLREMQLQQARENQYLAQLEARQAQAVLDRHIVRSPVPGVVVQRFLSAGESAEDRPIVRIAEIRTLRAETIVPVAQFGSIQPGQRAVIVPEAPLTGHYLGAVSVVDRVADAASGTFRARVQIDNPDHALPSGLRCSVRFLAPDETVAGNIPPPPLANAMPRSLGSLLRTYPAAAAPHPVAAPRPAATPAPR